MSKNWKIKCSIHCCQANLIHFPNRRFFKFPVAGSDKYKQWIEACEDSAEDIQAKKKPYICNIHFEENFFGKKFLKQNAVPSLYLKDLIDKHQRSPTPQFDFSTSRKTYGSKEKNSDITIEELNHASIILSSINSKSDSIEPVVCTSCPKYARELIMYKKQIKNLQGEVNKLRKTEKHLRKVSKNAEQKISRLRKSYKILKNKGKITIPECIDELADVEENSKTFAKMILSKQNSYTLKDKWLAQCLYFRSSANYNFMRNVLGFHMPHFCSLHKWIKIKSLSPGFDQAIFIEIKKQVNVLSAKERNVILIFDEMSIQENITYNQVKDRIDGYVDYGGGERENILAKSVCVFMIRSLCGKFKHVLHYVATPGCIPSDVLKQQVFKCLDLCTEMDLSVKAITCDQGPTNRKFYKLLNLSEERPFFEYGNEKIYAVYDVPHLFKSIRNRLLKGDLNTPDGVISWRIPEYLFNLEKGRTTKMCTKLTSSHIYPTEFQKMSVRLAVQVMSHSVASAILSLLALNKFPEELKDVAMSTAQFFQKINKLFDLLNGNPPLKNDNQHINFLLEMKSYISQIEPVNKKDMSFCFKGLLMTIESVLCLSSALFGKHIDLYYLYMSKLNQDPLENLFSHIRARNINKSNPSLFEFNALLAKIIALKILFTSKFSNCEEDNDEILNIDWNAVLVNTTHLKSLKPTSEENISPDCKNDIDIELEIDDFITTSPCLEIKCSDDPESTDVAIRYFSGYCFLKLMKTMKDPCLKCKEVMVKDSSSFCDPTEILIKLKRYESSSDVNSLIPPTDEFFNICRHQTIIFEKIFQVKSSMTEIKEFVVKKCKESTDIHFPHWFDKENTCHNHRTRLLEFMILVLFRKNCSWVMDVKRSLKRKRPQSKNKKMQALLNN